MFKVCSLFAIVLVTGSANAEGACNDIRSQQSYPPLSTENGVVCFIQKAIPDPDNEAPIGEDAIFLYYVANGNAPVEAQGRGLLYDDTPGEIIDAFSLHTGRERRERIFVVHAVEVRQSLVEPNSSGKFYSVSVFDVLERTLRFDERASDWFGANYGWLSDGRQVIYRFPYQSKKDVLQAIDSPFFRLIDRDEVIPVRIKVKSYLHEGPMIRYRTEKYLIEGDRATVDKASGGWCRVTYSGGPKSQDMWLMCSALGIDDQ